MNILGRRDEGFHATRNRHAAGNFCDELSFRCAEGERKFRFPATPDCPAQPPPLEIFILNFFFFFWQTWYFAPAAEKVCVDEPKISDGRIVKIHLREKNPRLQPAWLAAAGKQIAATTLTRAQELFEKPLSEEKLMKCRAMRSAPPRHPFFTEQTSTCHGSGVFFFFGAETNPSP